MQWLETRKDNNLGYNINLRLGTQDSHGGAFEQLVAMYLLRALHYPIKLKTIFDFHGTLPDWADEEAHVIGRLEGENVPVAVLGDAPENPGLSVAHFASSIDDVIQWIDSPNASAVLIPNNLFGLDIMMLCHLDSTTPPTEILIMGQDKSLTAQVGESLKPTTTAYAITSLHNSHWFKTAVSELIILPLFLA